MAETMAIEVAAKNGRQGEIWGASNNIYKLSQNTGTRGSALISILESCRTGGGTKDPESGRRAY
jgi:hypothetical protein